MIFREVSAFIVENRKMNIQTCRMIRSKAFRIAMVVLLSVLAFSFLPDSVSATGLVPCGDASTPCTLCHFITGIANIITRIRDVMFFIGLAIITAMGIVYIVSGGNPKLIETAKNGIKNTLIGIIFILFAWFIVNMVMFYIFSAWDDLGVGVQLRGVDGYEFECNATSRSGQMVANPGATTVSPSTSLTPVGTTAKCSDINAALKSELAAAGSGVPEGLLAAFMKRECAAAMTNPTACGSDNSYGAGGAMQFLASTWADYGCTGSRFVRSDALKCAAKKISRDSGGDYSDAGITKAARAYCGSCTNVNACGGNYCSGIIANYNVYKTCP